MAYNSDGYIMFDFSNVDFRRTTQTIPGLYDRCVKNIGTNKFILVINANGKTPLPSVCSFVNNQYVIESCIYTFAVTSADSLFIRRNDVPASDIIDDTIVSADKTWSSNKIDSELADYQPLLTAGTNITIDENNVISSTGGAVIDDSVIVNNKVWSSLNTVEQLAPIDTIINNPVEFKTSLSLPLIACKVSFSATQEGSGDPSPDNVRPIHGFSEVNVTANNVVRTIQFGQEVYGAEVDVVNGVAHCTHGYKLIDGTLTDNDIFHVSWYPLTNTKGVSFTPSFINAKLHSASTSGDIICDKRKTVAFNTIAVSDSYGIAVMFLSSTYSYSVVVRIPIDVADSKSAVIDYFANNPIEVAFELATPFDIQLTPQQIETLIGNNTISTDGDVLTVSYRQLPIDLI